MTQEEKEQLEKQERAACPACRQKRAHTEEEWRNHPQRGTGVEQRIAPKA